MEPNNLTPVLEADGVIVEVGEWLLISKTTLNEINSSSNPHYDIIQHGEVKTTSGKTAIIGKTIPILKLDISKLSDIGSERDVLNRKAGVQDVEYTYKKLDGELPIGLIEQINYTLNKDIERKSDKFTLTELQLSPIENYDIKALTIVTQQDTGNGAFSQAKLDTFLKGVDDRRNLLNKDFKMIKDMFYYGIINQDANKYEITQVAQNEDNPTDSPTKVVTYKSSKIVETTTTPVAKVQQQIVQQQIQTAQTNDQQSLQNLEQQIQNTGGTTRQALEQIQTLQKTLADNQTKR
jgi:hypothetical protein